ncbi:uncharacterized protein SCHCODRAFT_02105830 [Schizophyllum commune H4-8]|uniref:uncharacterized protein n=1 Tax=Schizophyllum commune (strain H4-8 / FGSC 9210) TaxID=578458 RepID=UPI0021605503|nr:uncharacterized protein SCHCODRAFT_02105830 [Schizophyllum commune H4-8]KAI5885792.1 hypothetical protein SCHCODRAFT_02105830 [Schizophyllum commune H4-8]
MVAATIAVLMPLTSFRCGPRIIASRVLMYTTDQHTSLPSPAAGSCSHICYLDQPRRVHKGGSSPFKCLEPYATPVTTTKRSPLSTVLSLLSPLYTARRLHHQVDFPPGPR